MKKAKRSKNLALIVAILVSISFVGGIPLIPIGFVGNNLVMAIIGIVLVAHGFYGVTFYWLWFASLVGRARVVRAIEEMNLYTVKEISEHLQQNPETVKKNIIKSIDKGWIVGLLFDGNGLYANDNEPLVKNGVRVKCDYCHTFYIRSRNMYKCPCCGATGGSEVQE